MPVIARRFMIMTLIFVNFAIAFSALAVREERVAFRSTPAAGLNCISQGTDGCADHA